MHNEMVAPFSVMTLHGGIKTLQSSTTYRNGGGLLRSWGEAQACAYRGSPTAVRLNLFYVHLLYPIRDYCKDTDTHEYFYVQVRFNKQGF